MPDRDLTRRLSRARFVARLRRLADALEAGGAFTLRVGGETLRIPADAALEIEHEREGADEELEFQVRWPRAAPGPRAGRRPSRGKRGGAAGPRG